MLYDSKKKLIPLLLLTATSDTKDWNEKYFVRSRTGGLLIGRIRTGASAETPLEVFFRLNDLMKVYRKSSVLSGSCLFTRRLSRDSMSEVKAR